MASSQDTPKVLRSSSKDSSLKLSSKSKKEKSNKKRKTEAVKDLEEQEPTTSQPAGGSLEDADTDRTTQDFSLKSSLQGRKDKSGRKRKAETLTQTESQDAIMVEDKKDYVSNPRQDPSSSGNDNDGEKRSSKKRKVLAAEIEVDVTAPEPPSKKALRALKKGKPLPPSKSGADSPEPEATAPKKEVEKRSEHGVWVGNLPFHVSKADLKSFIVGNSEITEEGITRVHMPGPNDNKSANKVEAPKKFVKVVNNKGFAYVDFSTAEAVKQAVDLSELLLGGRRVLIKDNKSFEGRPEKTKAETRNDGKPPSKRVFLGNLSFDTTEESLTEHFEKCGVVESVKVATFEDTGKCKGYAWIVFEELAGAENAVRGFVRIEEEISDASDLEEESDGESDSDNISKPKVKKTKFRKWWVNKFKGRPMRMEFAEDAQVRYKKRYGKEGTKSKVEGATPGGESTEEQAKPAVKKVAYRKDYAPRLTGGIVESKGSKVTFDQ